jgi:PAS domain-containing protein
VSFEVEWSGRTYASHCEPLRNPDGSIKGVIGIALDITRQKRTQRELQKSFSLLRATLDSAADAILVMDERGKISNFNESFVQMWSVPREIADQHDEDRMLAFLLDSVEDPGDFAKKAMGLHSRRDVETSGSVKLKDGRVLQRFSRPQKVDGKTVGTVLSFREQDRPIAAS